MSKMLHSVVKIVQYNSYDIFCCKYRSPSPRSRSPSPRSSSPSPAPREARLPPPLMEGSK